VNGYSGEPFDDGVVDVTVEDFERQVISLKRHFSVVGIDELCAFAAGDSLPPNPVAITFDDGYLDAYSMRRRYSTKHRCRRSYPDVVHHRAPNVLWDRAAYC
jgi:hypothetical protein